MAMPSMMDAPADPMAGAMPAPEMGMGAAPMSEICIPMASLSMEGEDMKSVAPVVGDPVDFTATGTVSRVEGGNAYVSLETVNGEPVAASEPAMPGDLGADDLRGMAEQTDQTSQDDQLY